MGYQVALTPSARADLREIVRYISLDTPGRAIDFGQFLVSQVRRLADHPEIDRIVPEFGEPSLREIVVRPYRVIYRIDAKAGRIDVVRFWHAARGIPGVSPLSIP